MSRSHPAPALTTVPYREVRRDQPEDCIHHESIVLRGREYGWSIPAHRHQDLHQLQWLSRGKVQARIDGGSWQVAAPALILVVPGCVHGFDYSEDSEGEQVTVPAALLQSVLSGAPDLLSQLDRCLVGEVHPSGGPAEEIQRLFEHVREEFQAQRPGRAQALMAWISLLFVQVARWAAADAGLAVQGRRGAIRDVLVQRFRVLVDRHYQEPLALKDYAARLGVTVDHLSRVCRASVGQHALEILHERRLREARSLLAHSELGIGEIADTVGMADAGYFSKFFTRAAGLTPSAYRRAARSGERA